MAQAQPPRAAVTVVATGPSASVQVAQGQAFEVRLGANPTTGYTWRCRVADPARLSLMSQHFAPGGGGAMRPGAGGAQVFVFEAAAAGAAHLHFEYRRGTGAPLRTYDLAVTIVP